MNDKQYLERMADCLDEAERTGSDADSPEGTRFITISDTFAKQIAMRLREIADSMEVE